MEHAIDTPVFKRILIANRGEIAVRVIHACRALGIQTVLVVSEVDKNTLGAKMADRVVCIGPSSSSESYLKISALIAVATGTQCEALHPGYGFLAESEDLARACEEEGIAFIGPSADQILSMGNKLQARALAKVAKVPMLSGSEKVKDAAHALQLAEKITYPVMLKAAAGGGGKGMKIVYSPDQMASLFSSASAESRSAFGDDTLYLEKYISNARHVEVQILGDHYGNLIHLGERDCSLQRRHQKVVEESPAPALSHTVREKIRSAALKLAKAINYRNAGTVEFILDGDTSEFYFLEMNTRIQVEHPVSESVTGVDLVEEQIRIASGKALGLNQEAVIFRGHAIECRINAEVPSEGFRPSPGLITKWKVPTGPNIRLDTHCFEGYRVPIDYDSMLAKLIVYGSDRLDAIRRLNYALNYFEIDGIGTTLPFIKYAITHSDFVNARVNTVLVEKMIKEMSISPKLSTI
jgi:acetyl-CoA carboxylase biotin carboxylase subunit